MKIGEVATLTGLSTKAIRHYHDIGLVVAARSNNGYREYTPKQQQQLMFVARCKSLGFSLEQCGQLLSLKQQPDRTADKVKTLAKKQLVSVREKITQLQQLDSRLGQLVDGCRGGSQADCPILNALNGEQCATQSGSLDKNK
ncbi:MerR family DNA-binding protein [Ferrimonas gelatinilytica]|uniref:HTH-type transcriptional regulator CueR n=1 Tax=Ferrimonas gelatinilytica TaxID=1255257 RepID=A0ABP9S0J9_9GAMM